MFTPLKRDGGVQVSEKGSHRQRKHPSKAGRVTVNGHPSDDLPQDMHKSILRQAGLRQ